MLPHDQKGDVDAVVGGHYRIEAELGHGGMARVYRACDERSGQRLALKRLTVGGERKATLQAMFEREYHTLCQLAHPRIVRAFDYGVDGDSPYYTMELLEGSDARATARSGRASVRDVCVLLRDTASALALIHSRRMVHRDVSLRNVWCTPDGRAKLIDFGTLVPMGPPQTRLAGTPPFVPPEAVYMQPLDARCDLYGLGAVAYYLLTQRNAYPAREIGELRQMWQRRPKRPDAIVPEVPRALADLVMALLSLDARGRPASAAEVVERLTAIGELAAEDERHLAQAFLTSPRLVGRDDAAASLRSGLQRARRKHGATAAIVAPAGLGRSRLLASLVLEAKLIGAATIAIDATAAGPAPFAVAAAIAESLLELLPMAAAAAVNIASVLGHVSPAVHRALGEPVLRELNAHERTPKLSSAVIALIEAASRRHNVVIAVDDVHRADGASLGVLARLSTLTAGRRLLIVTTCDEAALANAPPALEQLVRGEGRIALAALDVAHTRELLGSLFGEVAGLDEAAGWLHELSRGSPQTCMQYAQYLVDHGLARYEAGRWQLPERLRECSLPPTLGAMLDGRLAELSDDARALALGLALARDESRASWQPETHVRIEDFTRLLGLGQDGAAAGDALATSEAARVYAALDELLRAGMVQQRDTYYVVAQNAMVDALLRGSEAAAQSSMHARLAHIFEQPAYAGGLLPIRQLQRAGQHEQARAMLLRVSNRLGGSGAMQWGTMRVSVSAACTQTALAHFDAHGGSPAEGIVLRRVLLLTASVYDWSLARFGQAQIAQLSADCGLHHWGDTDPAKSPLERMVECLKRAQETYDGKPEPERGFAPVDAVRELAGCAVPLQAAYGHSHDVAGLRLLGAVLEPLCTLSPLIELVADLSQLTLDRTSGRETGERLISVGVDRMASAEQLPMVLRQGGAAINLYTQALLDARRGRTRPVDLMVLVAAGAGDDMFLVVHARWLAHAFAGRAEQARPLRRQVEVITEDDVWRRKASLFVEAELHALTGDLLGLQRTVAALAELTERFPGWRPWLSWTRAAQHQLCGELDLAEAELDAALAQAKPGEHRAWLRVAPCRAELRLLRGDAAGALRDAEAIVGTVKALSLDRTTLVAAERVRALAQSRLLDHAAAAVSLERAFGLARELEYGGLPLAVLHEAQARIALGAGRKEECTKALLTLHGLLAHADAPALINAYEALRAESDQLEIPELAAAAADPQRSAFSESGEEIATQVRTRLAVDDREERALQALELLLEDSGAESGHLFLFDTAGLFAAASVNDDPAGEALLGLARQHLDDELRRASTDAVTVAVGSTETTTPTVLATAELRLAPVLLSDGAESASLIGLALLAMRDAPLRPPRSQLVCAISRCLQTAGDSVPMVI